MKFDKSKVCVAGLHEVKEGKKGWFSNELHYLKEYVENEDRSMFYVYKGGGESTYEICDEGMDFKYIFFYPAPEKQYRPFDTIEEALTLKGKWIKHKHWDCFIEVTNIAMLNGCALINNIDPSFIYELYTMEDGTPIGVEV